MHARRTVEIAIRDAARSFACVVICGPRRAGKTTAARQAPSDGIRSVTLDDLDDRSLAALNPRIFLDDKGWPLLIEESRKAPALLPEIKKRIDDMKLRHIRSGGPLPLMYVLTLSNSFELPQEALGQMSGRSAVIEMSSMTEHEKRGIPETLFSPRISAWQDLEESGSIPVRSRM